MIRCLLVFLFLSFNSFFSWVIGQAVNDVIRTTGQFEVVYSPVENKQFQYGNLIIKEIAADADKNLQYTRIAIRYIADATFYRNTNNRPFLRIAFTNWKYYGDFSYRGFDLSEVLIPSRFSCILSLSGKGDSTINIQERVNDQSVSLPDDIIITGNIDFPEIRPDTIFFSETSFWYDHGAWDRFRDQIQLINDYYASAMVLDSLLKMAGTIDFRNVSAYPLYFIHLEEINKMVKLIGNKEFESKLCLKNFDPGNLVMKYRDLYKFTLSANLTFNESLEQTDTGNSSLSTDSLAGIFVSGMLRYIRWSLYGSWQNGRIYNEYLDGFYNGNAFGKDVDILKKLLMKMEPTGNPDSLIFRLSCRLQSAFNKQAEILSDHNQFAEAVELLENQRLYEKANPYLVKGPADNSTLSKAVNGIYSSYLDVAGMAIKREKLQLAANYMERAHTFRLANSDMINSDSLVREITLQYYAVRMMECERLATDKRYLDAIGCYNDFKQSVDSFSMKLLCQDIDSRIFMVKAGLLLEMMTSVQGQIRKKEHDSAIILFDRALLLKNSMPAIRKCDSITDSLSPVIEGFRYRKFLDDAQFKARMRNFSQAYIQLLKATDLSVKYNFKKDPIIDSLKRITYPSFLADKLSDAEGLIWTSHLEEAKEYADSVSRIVRNEHYMENIQLTGAIEKYRKKIEKKICWDAKDTFDIFQIRAWRNLELRNFIKASLLLDSAIILAKNRPECLPDPLNLRDSIVKYQVVIDYQLLLQKADKFVSAGQYREAITIYLQAFESFEKNKIGRFGLEKISLFDYIKFKSAWNFTMDAIEYYRGQKDYSESFNYLKLLRIQDFPAIQAKEVQTRLARDLSQRDYEENGSPDPVLMAKKYSEGDKWFTNFERAYIREWNVRKNERKAMNNEQ